ncbi:cation:proton antiporter [Lusitaniella coriacea]|uniref:cation:proton antiporter domain-containing protein n=1 Tax=Lusitaniella coriacea TaxID=1983105 RepID=UPI003CEF6A23
MQFLEFLPDTPLVSFTILILVALLVPPIFEKLHLPGLVGLLVAGILLGSNGLNLLDPQDDTIKLLSDAGKIYLMFVAGLEIDLDDFRNKKNRSLGFGVATFLLPLVAGIAVGRIFGFSWNASILIGSLLSSHTLLGYPIVNRLGVVRNEAVTVTIGATIFTDIAALLVLAICISIHQGEFTPASLAIQLGSLALYSFTVLYGIDRVGKAYFHRTGDEESNQFLFVLAAVFLAAVGAQLINVDKIVGAFLAGLAVNDVIGHSPVEEKVEFVGSTLFIPFFFVAMGLLLDIPTFVETITSPYGLGLTLAIIGSLIASKFLAALGVKLLYRYDWNEMLTMWSLSLPQVAATLAAALAGFQALNSAGDTLLSEAVFNTVIVMMLVTAILGPVLTARFARKLPLPQQGRGRAIDASSDWDATQEGVTPHPFTVVVPVYNPLTTKYLIEMGVLLARQESGTLVPLSIAKAHVHMDDPQLKISLIQSQKLLKRAGETSHEFDMEAKPILRIDDDIANAIGRVAREQNASLVVMGWSQTTGLRARLFGSVIDRVFWASHCPVAVMRLLEEPINIHRLLVPVKAITPRSLKAIRFAQRFADTNQASLTLLHVCVPNTPQEQIAAFEQKLEKVLANAKLKVSSEIKTVAHEDAAHVILKVSRSFELVILRSTRRRTAGGLAVSDVTTQVVKKLTCSLVLFGEPHS